MFLEAFLYAPNIQCQYFVCCTLAMLATLSSHLSLWGIANYICMTTTVDKYREDAISSTIKTLGNGQERANALDNTMLMVQGNHILSWYPIQYCLDSWDFCLLLRHFEDCVPPDSWLSKMPHNRPLSFDHKTHLWQVWYSLDHQAELIWPKGRAIETLGHHQMPIEWQ